MLWRSCIRAGRIFRRLGRVCRSSLFHSSFIFTPVFRKLKALCTDLEKLIPVPGKGALKRMYISGKTLCDADSAQKKIARLREEVASARSNFLVCHRPKFFFEVMYLSSVFLPGKEQCSCCIECREYSRTDDGFAIEHDPATPAR